MAAITYTKGFPTVHSFVSADELANPLDGYYKFPLPTFMKGYSLQWDGGAQWLKLVVSSPHNFSLTLSGLSDQSTYLHYPNAGHLCVRYNKNEANDQRTHFFFTYDWVSPKDAQENKKMVSEIVTHITVTLTQFDANDKPHSRAIIQMEVEISYIQTGDTSWVATGNSAITAHVTEVSML